MDSIKIRIAEREDADLIIELIKELAIYEKEPHAVKARSEDIIRDGFGPSPYFYVLIAEWNGRIAGFAFYFFNYSTWEGRPGLYLEDLFIKPEFRKKGIGKAIMSELTTIAKSKNCSRITWQVLNWNQPAIDFYESIGARQLPEWLTYRVTSDQFNEWIEKLK